MVIKQACVCLLITTAQEYFCTLTLAHRTKSEDPNILKRFLIDFREAFNDKFCVAKLRVLRSDGAGELNSEVVRKVLQDNGIAQQNSAPNDKFQDGKVERIIGVVNSMARVIMIFSKAPKKLWEYAIRQLLYFEYYPQVRTKTSIHHL